MNAIQRWFFIEDSSYKFDKSEDLDYIARHSKELWCKAKDVETLETLVSEATQKTIRARADRTIADDLVKSLRAEIIDKDIKIDSMYAKLDLLLNHCTRENGECSFCGSVICPHGDGMHFHHDGCPSCAEDGSDANVHGDGTRGSLR